MLILLHRQFVWTIPKVLRVFLRHDRERFADLGRLLFDILMRCFSQAAGKALRFAMVSSHQICGEFGVWHPNWHTIVSEGGFDHHDTLFFRTSVCRLQNVDQSCLSPVRDRLDRVREVLRFRLPQHDPIFLIHVLDRDALGLLAPEYP